jgi:hypothetical protein
MNSRRKMLFVAAFFPLLLVVPYSIANAPSTPGLHAYIDSNYKTCNNQLSGFFLTLVIYVRNGAGWPQNPTPTYAPSSRNTIANTFNMTGNNFAVGPAPVSPPPASSLWDTSIAGPGHIGGPIGVTWTATWAVTSNARPDRQSPLVLPGETQAVVYYGVGCQGDTPGTYQAVATVVGTFNGQSVTLRTPPFTYHVTSG